MKLHSIFSKTFGIWWGVMAVVSILKYYLFGLPAMTGYEGYGIIFWTIGVMFTGLIFGSILYLLYRLFWRKWNNKVFIILISVMWFLVLVTQKSAEKKMKESFESNVEFKDYFSLDLGLNDNQYYHSKVNNFRIQIPQQWILMKGQALGIEVNSVSPDEGAMFSVQIANLKNNKISIEDISDDFFLQLFKSNRVKEMKILFAEKTTIANQNAKHCLLSLSYNHLNENIDYLIDSYIFIYNDKLFHLICKTKKEYGQNYSDKFQSILTSFMLEYYK